MIKKIDNILKVVILIVTLLFCSVPFLSKATWVGTQNNATLFLSPDVGTYRGGATFPIDVLINTHGQKVVGVSAYFTYNTSLFRVISIDVSASLFNVEWENINDTTNGVVKISRTTPGGATAPGVNTASGKVATLNIQGLANVNPSSDNFNFTFTVGVNANSQVILDDQMGTNVLSGVDNGRYTIDATPPANVSSFTATAGDGQVSLSWTNPASDFSGVKILRKTGSYPTSPTDGTQVYDNNGTSYTDTGLTNSTTYYYTAFSRDVVLNYSSGAQATATPHDVTAPAAISTLSATALTAKSVRLNWTAVGDDGNTGTALSYDIRYSTASITAANFASATQVSGASVPKASGSAETITISGLSGFTNYYFAVKAIDEGNNASAISNLPNAKTFKISDLNNDGLINVADAGIMMSYWNSAAKPSADLNQDGIVNINDAGIMMSEWG